MKVEWDPAKARANSRKHGIDFAEAATVLFDELATTIRDDSADEEGYVTIGADALHWVGFWSSSTRGPKVGFA